MKRSKRNGKLQRAAVLFTVLVFAASVFAVTAFATEITPAPDSVPSTESTVTPTIPTVDPNAGTTPDPNVPVTPPDPNTTVPVDPNTSTIPPDGELPSDPNASITPGESLPEGTESIPEETTSSEVEVSTPKEPENTYTPPVSKKPTPQVNTDNAQINQAASKAAQATSDPDLLSSQDWSELLTSGEVSQSPSAKPFEGGTQSGGSQTGEEAQKQGSFSWILPAGIGLIVLGLGGIAFFVYAQFFARRKREEEDSDDEDLEEFLDITSDSSGLQQRGDYLPPEEALLGEGLSEGEPSEGVPSEEVATAPVSEEFAEEIVTETEELSGKELTEEPPVLPRESFEIAQPDVRFIPNAKPGDPPSEPQSSQNVENPYGFKVEIMEDKKDADGNFDWDSFFDHEDQK